MKVLALAGYSGSGKTQLIEALIPALRQSGARVSVIKHAHHGFDIDQPGKDTWPITGASFIMMQKDQADAGRLHSPGGGRVKGAVEGEVEAAKGGGREEAEGEGLPAGARPQPALVQLLQGGRRGGQHDVVGAQQLGDKGRPGGGDRQEGEGEELGGGGGQKKRREMRRGCVVFFGGSEFASSLYLSIYLSLAPWASR